MLLAELHAHSALSHDGRDSVDMLLEQARAVGLDVLAVTDHDEIDASLEAVDRAPSYDLVAVPAMEVSTADGHLIALGVRERVPAGHPFTDTLDRIHQAGGIGVVPHPFQKSRSGIGTVVPPHVLARTDAIEVYNSRLLTGRGNRRAKSFAETHDIPMTAGSDAHISEMVGQAVTEIDAEPTSRAVVEAIRDGRTVVVGKRTPWHISFRQAAGGAKRRVLNRVRNLR